MSSAEVAEELIATASAAKIVIERPSDLFGDAPPSTPTPLDRLRLELREVSLGSGERNLAWPKLLVYRGRHLPTRLADVSDSRRQRWRLYDGEPIAGDWPPLPSVTDEDDAA